MRKKLSLRACALAIPAIALISLAAWADAGPQMPPPVPEPTSWVLFGIGALGAGWAVKRRRRG
jgi:hypothetical protein